MTSGAKAVGIERVNMLKGVEEKCRSRSSLTRRDQATIVHIFILLGNKFSNISFLTQSHLKLRLLRFKHTKNSGVQNCRL